MKVTVVTMRAPGLEEPDASNDPRFPGVRPAVRAILEPVMPLVGPLVRWLPAGAAVVVVAADRDVADIARELGPVVLHLAPGGAHYGAGDLWRIRRLAKELAEPVAHHLGEPLPAGEVWCLVLAAAGVAAHPIGWAFSESDGN